MIMNEHLNESSAIYPKEQTAVANTNKRGNLFRTCSLTLLIGVLPSIASAVPPVLQFSDLTWGPKSGWEGSSTKGAAVTIWGENLGTVRGSNFVTVNGAALTADTDYAEWGTNGPARGLQRITFWLNSNCTDGPGNITVTVNGVASNTLPFNVSPAPIYFVSASGGNNNNNGLYSTSRGGSNGPFHDVYKFGFQNNPSGDAQYIVYVRNGMYTAQDPAGDSTAISYRGPSGGPSKQKALIAYPAETPTIDATGMSRGVIWNADYSPYGRNGYLTYSKITIINGTEAFYIYGDNIRVIGNHFQNMMDMVWSGVVFVANSQNTKVYGNFFDHNGATNQGSYKHQLYLITETLSEVVVNTNSDVGWNEFANAESGTDNRGGNIFMRTDGSVASTIQTNHVSIHDNSFHGGNQDFIEIGDGPPQDHIWIYNNTFTGGPSVNSALSVKWTTSNVYLYNNTFYLAGSPTVPIVDVVGISPPGSQLTSANNIFYAAAGQGFFNVESGSTMTSDHDLFFSASGTPAVPSGSGLTLTNPIVGDPLFVNGGSSDFHLQAGSPAIDAGTSSVNTTVTQDFDGLSRPQGAQYDVGALEYPLGGAPLVISVGITPASVSLPATGTQQFTATVGGTSTTAVTWSLNPAIGTLSATGLYTAPNSISAQQIIQVTAISVADATKSAVANVTLLAPAPVVAISVTPGTANLGPGQIQQLTAEVTGSSNSAVAWSLNPALGTISSSGLYTAPASITTQQSVVVTAIAAADPTKTATAKLILVPPAPPAISVSVSPSGISLGQGQSQQFSASVTGSNNNAVTWSMNPVVGTLSSAGLYTAPASITSLQSVQIKATSAADPNQSGSVTLTLTPAVAPPPPPVGAPTPAPGTAGYNVSWSALSGKQLTVAWSAPAGHSPYDSIIMTGYGAVGWWNAWSGQTGGAVSGTFTVTLPTDPGIWQFRYISNAKNQVMAVSADLPVNVSQFSVTANSTTAQATGIRTVSWTAPAGRPQTWADTIGLYRVGATNDAPIWQQYTMGATGGMFKVRVAKPGTYEFRYVVGYVSAAHSAPVIVAQPMKSLTHMQRTH